MPEERGRPGRPPGAAAARGMRASVDVILHATEDEALYRAALGSVLGVDGAAAVASSAEGHYGNRIRILSARERGAGAARLAAAVSSSMPAADAAEVAENITLHVSGSGLHLRFDKQRFVRGRLALGGAEAVRVVIYAPSRGGAGAAREAYARLLADR